MTLAIRLSALALTVLLAAAPVAAPAASFTISANGMADNAVVPQEGAYSGVASDGSNRPCGGVNKAPGWTWSSAPDKTQSFAILEFDADGRAGLGVSHWVLYNIPAGVSSISTADVAANKYTPGRGTGDLVGYRGPCPPPADAPHHYLVTIYALDLPSTLPASLDRDGLQAAMKGHIVGATSTVMRYPPPK